MGSREKGCFVVCSPFDPEKRRHFKNAMAMTVIEEISHDADDRTRRRFSVKGRDWISGMPRQYKWRAESSQV